MTKQNTKKNRNKKETKEVKKARELIKKVRNRVYYYNSKQNKNEQIGVIGIRQFKKLDANLQKAVLGDLRKLANRKKSVINTYENILKKRIVKINDARTREHERREKIGNILSGDEGELKLLKRSDKHTREDDLAFYFRTLKQADNSYKQWRDDLYKENLIKTLTNNFPLSANLNKLLGIINKLSSEYLIDASIVNTTLKIAFVSPPRDNEGNIITEAWEEDKLDAKVNNFLQDLIYDMTGHFGDITDEEIEYANDNNLHHSIYATDGK